MKLSVIIINHDWKLSKNTVKAVKNSAGFSEADAEIRIADLTGQKYENQADKKKYGCAKTYYLAEGKDSFSQIIDEAEGQYIMLLDSGDLPDEHCLENLQKGMEDSSIALIYADDSQPMSVKLTSVFEKQEYLNLRDEWKFVLKMKQAFVFEKECFKVPFDLSHLDLDMELWCRMTFAMSTVQAVKVIGDSRVVLGPVSARTPLVDAEYLNKLIGLLDILGDEFNCYFSENMQAVPRILQYQQLALISNLLKSSHVLTESLTKEQIEALDSRLTTFIQGMDYMTLLTDAMNRTMLLYACQKKPGTELKLFKAGKEHLFYEGNQKLMSLSRHNFRLHFIEIKKNTLYLEGVSASPLMDKPCEVFVRVNQNVYPMDLKPHDSSIYWLDKKISDSSIFSRKIKLNPGEKQYDISFFMQYGDQVVEKTWIQFGKYAPIEGTLEGSYYYRDGWLLECDGAASCLKLKKSSPAEQKQKEKQFQSMLMKRPEVAARKAALVRKAYFAQQKTDKRQVWLISDRTNRGDDNGEAFFRYVMEQKDRLKDKDIYFVLEKGSSGYEELKKIGKVVSPMSWKHKMLHLRSSYVISSQGNDPVVNPFHRKHIYYKDLLCDMRFVFLQHGITKDNQSAWLNKYNRNIYGLITTTREEYDSMLEYDYYYTSDRIWLTGMPRYDLLYHDEKKYITIMPTWRKSLMSGTDVETGIWQLKEGFEESSYLKFYNALLNHEGLIEEAGKLGYKICFMPHPNIAPYVSYFTKHPEVEFFDATKSYRQVFAEADMMLTDYSSVAFDFAYLRKPIVYSQFDYKEFFSGSHSYTEGYFDYERDGFGEITHDLQSTVDIIIDYMRNGCALKPMYRERIDATFAFSGEKCSEHVLKKILGEK